MIPRKGNHSLRAALAANLEELWVWLLGIVPTAVGTMLRMAGLRLLFASGAPRMGIGCLLRGCANMHFGPDVRIMPRCSLYARNGLLQIGTRSALNSGVFIDAEDGGRISIGSDCGIGPGTVLRAANHRFEHADVPISMQGHKAGTITVEDDVWIGANCTILPDVRIGTGAVVGAGAVVTRDVPPYAIVTGVPARVTGSRKPENISDQTS
ncbi:acyltransferase [Oleidesulfovibrio sp.]|uniref:acyltransferase n=1 Tax=Oleidesulfovibrio sp. TaxID=2909707 RepID=UPI003A89BACD